MRLNYKLEGRGSFELVNNFGDIYVDSVSIVWEQPINYMANGVIDLSQLPLVYSAEIEYHKTKEDVYTTFYFKDYEIKVTVNEGVNRTDCYAPMVCEIDFMHEIINFFI